jgi:hypothetical protein
LSSIFSLHFEFSLLSFLPLQLNPILARSHSFQRLHWFMPLLTNQLTLSFNFFPVSSIIFLLSSF